MKPAIQHIHFVGIGGSGMSGIAVSPWSHQQGPSLLATPSASGGPTRSTGRGPFGPGHGQKYWKGLVCASRKAPPLAAAFGWGCSSGLPPSSTFPAGRGRVALGTPCPSGQRGTMGLPRAARAGAPSASSHLPVESFLHNLFSPRETQQHVYLENLSTQRFGVWVGHQSLPT